MIQGEKEMDAQERAAERWNRLIAIVCAGVALIGLLILYFPNPEYKDVVAEHYVRIIILTLLLPIITFLAATAKLPREATLILLGSIVGYAFGTGTLGQ